MTVVHDAWVVAAAVNRKTSIGFPFNFCDARRVWYLQLLLLLLLVVLVMMLCDRGDDETEIGMPGNSTR